MKVRHGEPCGIAAFVKTVETRNLVCEKNGWQAGRDRIKVAEGSALQCAKMQLFARDYAGASQLFSRYPVLKIHTTPARQATKNASVIARLTPTPTSEVS
jgi:hypothetical protein